MTLPRAFVTKNMTSEQLIRHSAGATANNIFIAVSGFAKMCLKLDSQSAGNLLKMHRVMGLHSQDD